MFTEDPSVFMQDFGVLVTWFGVPWAIDRSGPSLDSSKYVVGDAPNTQTALALKDQPDGDVLGDRAQSRAYKITFPATQFVGIKRADAIVIGGVKYSVINASSIDDGALFEATLEAV